jgi:heat shock protein HslJ
VRRLVIGLAIAAIGFSVFACSTSGGTGGTIDGTNWQLKSYVASGTSTDVPAGVVVDAKFSGGNVAGFGGCNSYGGTATVSGSTIKIGDIRSTLMLCEGPAGDVETAYFAALPTAATFTATADDLTLYDSTGKAILSYEAGSDNPLEGAWNVTGYNNGNEAVTSPAVGTTLTATFTPDGKVAGSAGCNDYNGAYTLDGTSLTVGPLASTKKACDQAVMDQETQFLTALQTPTTVEPSGATITLRAADGATQVVLAPQ